MELEKFEVQELSKEMGQEITGGWEWWDDFTDSVEKAWDDFVQGFRDAICQ